MAITITGITPNSEADVGLVEVEISGIDFTTILVSAYLEYSGAPPPAPAPPTPDIQATNFKLESTIQITCDFDVYGAMRGTYNLVVVDSAGGTYSLANAFEIIANDNYCTFTDIKRFCLLDRYNANYNQKIIQIIPKASMLIDVETKRVWNMRGFLETHDNETNTIEDTLIFPKYYPIDQVFSLIYNGTTQVKDTNFYVYKTYIKGAMDWLCEPHGLVLSYSAGNPVVPNFIRQLAIEIASIMANLKTVTYTTAEGIDQAVIVTSFPDYIQSVYKKYKKVEIW